LQLTLVRGLSFIEFYSSTFINEQHQLSTIALKDRLSLVSQCHQRVYGRVRIKGELFFTMIGSIPGCISVLVPYRWDRTCNSWAVAILTGRTVSSRLKQAEISIYHQVGGKVEEV